MPSWSFPEGEQHSGLPHGQKAINIRHGHISNKREKMSVTAWLLLRGIDRVTTLQYCYGIHASSSRYGSLKCLWDLYVLSCLWDLWVLSIVHFPLKNNWNDADENEIIIMGRQEKNKVYNFIYKLLSRESLASMAVVSSCSKCKYARICMNWSNLKYKF